MNCVQYKDRISLLILDELDESAAIELKKHLGECEECQKEYDELKEVIKIIEPDINASLSPEEKADILINLNRSFTPAQPVSQPNSFSALLKIAAAILIFAMGFYTNQFVSEAPDDIKNISTQVLAKNVQQTSFKNYRLSSAGFKLIAKGKAALDSTNTN